MQKLAITLVPATLEHLDQIKVCAEQAYLQYVERMGKKPAPMVADFKSQIGKNHITVALTGDSLAGFVVFYPDDRGMHLENVAVCPTYQGAGLGRRLVEHVEERASVLQLSTIHLYTNVLMVENFALYEYLGYGEVERRREDGFERVFFCKRLV